MAEAASVPPRDQARPLSWLDIPSARPQPPAAGHSSGGDRGRVHLGSGPPFGVVRGRAGFDAGGPADVMTPCSVLAELTGQAAGRMSELSDDELIGVLKAARRVQA